MTGNGSLLQLFVETYTFWHYNAKNDKIDLNSVLYYFVQLQTAHPQLGWYSV